MKPSQAEFEQMAMAELDSVYRVARRLAGKPEDAEDLVQETFLRALRARDSFVLQEFGIRPWLFRILHNVYLTKRQRDSRQPMAMGDEQIDALAVNGASEASSGPLDARMLDGMDQELVRALEALPAEYRSVLVMWAVEDLSYKEIAEALEVPIGTVMSRLHRARAKMAGELHDFALGERIIRE